MKTLKINFLVLFTFWITNLQAQELVENVKTAYTHPIQNIKIDGKLSDWNDKNLQKYAINKVLWGGQKGNENNFSAYFMTGYNLQENALYLALVIRDNENFLAKEKPAWHNQDSYTFYIDEQHNPQGSGIARYSFAENFKDLTDLKTHWDKKLKGYLGWDKIEYEINTRNNQKFIEIKYRLKDKIYSGKSIGLGHMVRDMDKDSETTYAWIGRGGKSSSAQLGRIGTLIFLDNPDKIAKVKGKAVWKDKVMADYNVEALKVFSETDPKFWDYIRVDNEGNVTATLPEGSYRLSPALNFYFRGADFHKPNFEIKQKIEVKANQENNFGTYNIEVLEKPKFSHKENLLYNLNKENQGKLDKAIQNYMDFYGIEGASFLALKDGKIAYQQTYGVKNNYTKEKVSEETLFEVASITKPVFAFVVLRLYEKGIIDLDKPLYQYLAFEKKTNQEYAKLITARHVLSHQTGFPNWARNGKLEFLFRPGTAFGYSGEGFEYLKRVVEKITEKNIIQVLQEELIEPLELENFHFEMNEAVLKHKAHGHFNSYSGLIDMFDPPLMAASLVTNPKSFAKFMLALQERKGLKPETYKLFFSPQITVPKDVRENQGNFEEYMSLGLFVEKTPYGRVFRHSGNNGDFKGVFRVFEDLEVAYILMVNGNTGFYLVDAIDKILVDIEAMKEIKH